MINSTYRIVGAAVCALIVAFCAWWFWPIQTTLRQVSFDRLPGWKQAELRQSLAAFQISCAAFVKQNPEQSVGTDLIAMQVKDWLPACREALTLNDKNAHAAKRFFEKWFAPVAFYEGAPVQGLFTGYYMPQVQGSHTKTPYYSTPIYTLPDNLITVDLGMFSPDFKNRKIVGRVEGKTLVPYYTREQITKGALKGHASVLLWIHSPIDRLFLEIQGSGIVVFEDGTQISIGYDGQNGAPYTAIAGVLIKKGVMTRENASMQGIKRYLEAHPKEMHEVINQNKSFIFFRKLAQDAALGSQGVPLTPGYSLAVDKQWIPMGVPLWLSTTRPISTKPDKSMPMQRLMIAQDTGGAIRGKVRGDVFWGDGKQATIIAGHMKNKGYYWLLLPKAVAARIAPK